GWGEGEGEGGDEGGGGGGGGGGNRVGVVFDLRHAGQPRVGILADVAGGRQPPPVLLRKEVVGPDHAFAGRQVRLRLLAEARAVVVHAVGRGPRLAQQLAEIGLERRRGGGEAHETVLVLPPQLELRRVERHRDVHVQGLRKARGRERLGRGRVAVAEEEVGRAARVLPGADEVGGRVRPRLRERGHAARAGPAFLDEVDAERAP